MKDHLHHDHLPEGQNDNNDGVDRRGFLECMAWAGTGVLWMMSGGVMKSYGMSQMIDRTTGRLRKGLVIPASDFSFVQISDSHIGFNKPANTDVVGTMQAAIDKINALPMQPEFLIHTGDLTHQSKPGEFDGMDQVLKSVRAKDVFYVPGEHDTSVDDGKAYLERYGKDPKGKGWYSFDHKGVHFVGLVNVMMLEGMGKLGADQIQWLEDDLKGKSASTPVVLFAHIPLWTGYPEG